MELDDSFGFKLDYLLEGCTKYIQQLLIKKSNEWNTRNKKNFFTIISRAQWTVEEAKKVQSREISRWDMSLCAKCLLEFNWGPSVTPPNPAESAAIVDLRNVRNYSKHLASPNDVTQDQFDEKCEIVERALLTLNAIPNSVKKLIEAAQNRVSADKNNINQVVENWKFTTIDVLGSGSCGVVIAGYDPLDEKTYAIKLVPNRNDLTQSGDQKSRREASNWSKLDFHHNVVKYQNSERFMLSKEKIKEILNWERNREKIGREACEYLLAAFQVADQSNSKIRGFYIKTELCGETLREWLEKQAEEKGNQHLDQYICEKYGKEIINGLYHIHKHKLVHRDLRPNNIFFAKPNFQQHLKIGDFGLSNQVHLIKSQTLTKDAGDSLYRAPEVDVVHKDGKANYSQAVDLFSLGLIFSELFDPVLPHDLNKKLGRIRYSQDTGLYIRKNIPWLNEFILKLTNEEPDKRYTSDKFGKPQLISFPVDIVKRFHDSQASGNFKGSSDIENLTAATDSIQLQSPFQFANSKNTLSQSKTTSRLGANFNAVEQKPNPSSTAMVPTYNIKPTVEMPQNNPNTMPEPLGSHFIPKNCSETNMTTASHMTEYDFKPIVSPTRSSSSNNFSPRNVSPINVLLPLRASPKNLSPRVSPPIMSPVKASSPNMLQRAISPRFELGKFTSNADEPPIALQNNQQHSPTISDEGIVEVRKLLMQNKPFWNSENVAKFFSALDGTNSSDNASLSSPTKSTFNSKLYGLRGSNPNLVTELNIISALHATGFSVLAEKLKKKWKIP